MKFPPSNAQPQRQRSALPRGLTLVEVLLTMALLVTLASLAWPAFSRPLANQRLRNGAEQLRADWTRGRIKAMSSGRTYIFHYFPETDRYSIQPANSGDGAPEEASAGGADLDAPPPQSASNTPTAGERLLPEGITFLNDPGEQQKSPTLPGAAGGLDDSSGTGGGAAFDAVNSMGEIRFNADGTTSTARVTLKNQFDRSIELRLRGLTGVVTVGDVQSMRSPEGAPQP
jgi:prepilin-type N-terminal cleavage/methylation domain-containing protein